MNYQQVINKISEWLNVRSDLILHFIVSATIMLCLSFILPNWIAASVTLLIGIIKELYDCVKSNPTGFDKLDIFADILGILTILTIW